MIRYVFFDAGGTLIDPYPSVGEIYAQAGRPHGLTVSAEALQAAFRVVWGQHIRRAGDAPMTFGRDTASTRAWWRTLVFEVLREVGFTGDRDACFVAFFTAFESPKAWRIFDDVGPVLDALEARHLPKGVISNWDFRLPPLLERLALAPRFQPILVSAFEGVAKPDPELYRRAVEKSGMPPESILYVGDHRDLDLEPALSVGLNAYLIDRNGTHTGDRVVRRLTDLLQYL